MRDDRQPDSDKFQLSLYLMPFLGAILAGLKLGSKSPLDSEERKTSRLSLRMGLVWLVIYSTLWFGGHVTSDIWAILNPLNEEGRSVNRMFSLKTLKSYLPFAVP